MKFDIEIHNSQSVAITTLGVVELAQRVWQNLANFDGTVDVILVDDERLSSMNREFLNKDDLTDVIAFPLSTEEESFAGEIYISVDRIIENAKTFQVDSGKELKRVVIHGLLHFLGYDDKLPSDKEKMTVMENHFLAEV